MEAIRKPEVMQKVGWAAEILSPLAKRGLMCKPFARDRSRHRTMAEAAQIVQQQENVEQQMLLRLAFRGLSPKLHIHCTPEVQAMIEGMESITSKLMEDVVRPETVHGSVHLTDAELRGVHAIIVVHVVCDCVWDHWGSCKG